MRNLSISIMLAALLVVGLAAAPAAVAADTSQQDTDEVVDAYNQNVDEIPDFVKNRFADERVAVTIERDDAEPIEHTAVTDKSAHIVELEDGIADPTIRIITDEQTLREISNAENPVEAGTEAYKSEDVTVEGVGVTNTVVIETAKFVHRLGSSLGLL